MGTLARQGFALLERWGAKSVREKGPNVGGQIIPTKKEVKTCLPQHPVSGKTRFSYAQSVLPFFGFRAMLVARDLLKLIL